MDKELLNFYRSNPQLAENARKSGINTTAKAVEKSGKLCYLQPPMSGGAFKKAAESPSVVDPSANCDDGKKRWLTVRELADYLGSTPGAIRNMVYREKLTAYKPFGLLLFDKNEIDRIIQSHPVRAWYEKG